MDHCETYMKKPRFHIWYSYKSGLGAELVRIAPLIRRLADRFDICVTSFHSFIYDRRFDAHLLNEETMPAINILDEELGVCFFCDWREDGPACWPSMAIEARHRGWPTITEDLGQPDVGVYEAAENVAERLVPRASGEETRSILRKPERRHDFLVLNIFGGSAIEKGVATPEATRSLIESLSVATPNERWVVPSLPHQQLASVVEEVNAPNVSLLQFDYGNAALSEMFYAKAVVTVEGGGLHVAVEHGVPTLLLSSPAWISATRSFLPPAHRHATVLGDMAASDQSRIAAEIADWALGTPS
jgi:hypothetical protein